MSTPNARIPTWATDSVVASTYLDAGLPVRVEPSEGTKAQGFIGGQAVSAAEDNWRAGASCDWLNYLAPIQARSWRRDGHAIPWTGASDVRFNPAPASIGSGTWLLPGWVSGSFKAAVSLNWPAPQNAALEVSEASRLSVTGASLAFTSVGVAGSVICYGVSAAGSAATVVQVYLGTVTGATVTQKLLSTDFYAPTRVAASGSVIIVLNAAAAAWIDGGHYWVSTDSGTTFVQKTITGSPVAKTVGHIVANPSGAFVIAMWDDDVIVFVSDYGNSLTYTGTPGSAGFTGLAWRGDGWIALTRSEKYLVRWTGSVWATIATLSVGPPNIGSVPVSGLVLEGNMLACDGGRLLCVPTEQSGVGLGMAWSIDSGETWHYDTLCQTYSTSHRAHPIAIAYGGGEFLLLVDVPNLDGSGTACEIWKTCRL